MGNTDEGVTEITFTGGNPALHMGRHARTLCLTDFHLECVRVLAELACDEGGVRCQAGVPDVLLTRGAGNSKGVKVMRNMQRRTTLIFRVCCVLCALAQGGCKSEIVIMAAPSVRPEPRRVLPNPSPGLRAGAYRIDITPPPGLPSLGFSIAAKYKQFKGHQTRLRAYCLVLEDARGERIALVTMDLAWSSTILRWKIVEALKDLEDKRKIYIGITVDRILLAGTHTHGGPAGFSSWALFNDQILGPGGYDRELVSFLVKRISEAIVEACYNLKPARLAICQTLVTDLTENRSRKAHLRNPDVPIGSDGIDPLLTVFRVESNPKKGIPNKPIAAFCVFAGHPTVSGPRRSLWHADVFGVATSKARRAIGQQEEDFVVALANGPEGDVVFRWQHGGAQDHATTVYFGSCLAKRIARTWNTASECDFDSNPLLASRLEQHDLPGAALRSGKMLAREPSAGVAGIGGSEEGYSFLYPVLAREGMRRWFPGGGDHGAKSAALGPLQPLLMSRKTAPTFAPIQVMRIGDYYLIALPFEVTVQNAVGIRQQVKQELADIGVVTSEAKILVISAANDYCFYCATAEEYDVQHYEGAYTFYGPNTAQFLAERSANAAVALTRGDKQPTLHGFSFPVGQWAQGGHAMPATPTSDSTTTKRKLYLPHSDGNHITMLWWGLPRDRIRIHSSWLVGVRAKHELKIYMTKADGPENDLGLNFEIELLNQRNGKGLWKVTWHPNDRICPGTYQFVIAERPGALEESSEFFEVPPVRDR